MNLNKVLMIAVGATLIVLAGLYIRTQTLEKATSTPSPTAEISPAQKFYTRIEACAMTSKEEDPVLVSVDKKGNEVTAQFAGILHAIEPSDNTTRLAVTSLDLQQTAFFLTDTATKVFDASNKEIPLTTLKLNDKIELATTCTYNKENTTKVSRITIKAK